MQPSQNIFHKSKIKVTGSKGLNLTSAVFIYIKKLINNSRVQNPITSAKIRHMHVF